MDRLAHGAHVVALDAAQLAGDGQERLCHLAPDEAADVLLVRRVLEGHQDAREPVGEPVVDRVVDAVREPVLELAVPHEEVDHGARALAVQRDVLAMAVVELRPGDQRLVAGEPELEQRALDLARPRREVHEVAGRLLGVLLLAPAPVVQRREVLPVRDRLVERDAGRRPRRAQQLALAPEQAPDRLGEVGGGVDPELVGHLHEQAVRHRRERLPARARHVEGEAVLLGEWVARPQHHRVVHGGDPERPDVRGLDERPRAQLVLRDRRVVRGQVDAGDREGRAGAAVAHEGGQRPVLVVAEILRERAEVVVPSVAVAVVAVVERARQEVLPIRLGAPGTADGRLEPHLQPRAGPARDDASPAHEADGALRRDCDDVGDHDPRPVRERQVGLATQIGARRVDGRVRAHARVDGRRR